MLPRAKGPGVGLADIRHITFASALVALELLVIIFSSATQLPFMTFSAAITAAVHNAP